MSAEGFCCPECKQPLSVQKIGTSFGNDIVWFCGWHGYVAISDFEVAS